MKNTKPNQQGFSLIELMVASIIGVLLSYGIMEIYVAQTQIYKTTNSQDLIQNTENAIANLVTPVVRSTGFVGCSTISTVVSNLNGGGSDPIGSVNTNPTLVRGYNSNTNSIIQDNQGNSTSGSDWNPSLDPSLIGNVQNTSDVVVLLGAVPGSYPVGITSIDTGSTTLTVQTTNGLSLTPGQFAAVSDCVKASLFQITAVSGTTITHASGSGPYGNASDTFAANYQVGSQFIPLQQTAFFVGQGPGGQSALMRGILSGGTWSIQSLVPGVDVLKIQYGTGTNGTVSQYQTADAISNWGAVYSIRLGFLIAGQTASAPRNNNTYTVLGNTVTVPSDNRLRHVYEVTINLRNAT